METYSDFRTGLVFDDVMERYCCLWDSDCPECPVRLSSILTRCREYGLVDRCRRIPVRPASREDLQLVHSDHIIGEVQSTKNMTDAARLEDMSSKYFATFYHPDVYDAAVAAAGGAVELVTAILKRKVRNGMAIVRPPGHHAMHDEVCGYCFFNNVAIAAKVALRDFAVDRILIIDWDVHHGQATQYSFYDDPRVLYFSLHRYENGTTWPFLRESNFDFTGTGAGLGYNINVPLQETGLGNADYLDAFFNVLLPVAYEFAPQLVLVSAGFDSALGDPKGQMEVTPAAYTHLLTSLMGLAEGRVCVVLEGGYCLQSLSEGAALCLRTLLGDPAPVIGAVGPAKQSMKSTILNCLSTLRPQWRSLRLQGQFSAHSPPSKDSFPRHEPRPVYKGADLAVKPPKYKTRKFYPVLSDERKRMLQDRLQKLRDTTDLALPPPVTLVATPRDLSAVKDVMDHLQEEGLASRFHTVQVELPDRRILKAVDAVLRGQARNAVVFTGEGISCPDILDTAVEQVLDQYGDCRILLVDISGDDASSGKVYEDSRVLKVTTTSGPHTRGHMSLSLQEPPCTAGDLVAAFLHVLLPVAYEFNPGLVLVNCAVQECQVGTALFPETYWLLTRLLTPLAYERIVLIHKVSGASSHRVLSCCVSAVLGEPRRLPGLFPSHRGVQAIQDVVREQKFFWTKLQYQVDLPRYEGAAQNLA